MGTTRQLPTVLSLCSGYGGIERGLDLAGVEHNVLAYVEIEAFACSATGLYHKPPLKPGRYWTRNWRPRQTAGAVTAVTQIRKHLSVGNY